MYVVVSPKTTGITKVGDPVKLGGELEKPFNVNYAYEIYWLFSTPFIMITLIPGTLAAVIVISPVFELTRIKSDGSRGRSLP